jgi:methylmalonyl-CoA mutase C-terminal domain/subunit
MLLALDLMKQAGMNDVLLTGGGIIPDRDAEELNKLGVAKLFPPGTEMAAIVDYIAQWVKQNRPF